MIWLSGKTPPPVKNIPGSMTESLIVVTVNVVPLTELVTGSKPDWRTLSPLEEVPLTGPVQPVNVLSPNNPVYVTFWSPMLVWINTDPLKVNPLVEVTWMDDAG